MNRRSLFKTFAGLAAVPAAAKLAGGTTGVGTVNASRLTGKICASDIVSVPRSKITTGMWAPVNRMQSIALGRNDHEVAVIAPAGTGKTELAIAWMLKLTINMQAEDRKRFVGLLTAPDPLSGCLMVQRAKRLYAPSGRFLADRSEFVFPGGERILVRIRTTDLIQRVSGLSFSRQAHDGIASGSDFLVAKYLLSSTSRSVSGSPSSLMTMQPSVSCSDFPWNYLNFPHSVFDTSRPMVAWMNYGGLNDGTPWYGNVLF